MKWRHNFAEHTNKGEFLSWPISALLTFWRWANENVQIHATSGLDMIFIRELHSINKGLEGICFSIFVNFSTKSYKIYILSTIYHWDLHFVASFWNYLHSNNAYVWSLLVAPECEVTILKEVKQHIHIRILKRFHTCHGLGTYSSSQIYFNPLTFDH
jgi:hypothetical protein